MRLPLHPFNPRPPPLLLLCDFSIFLFFFRGSIQNYFVPTRTLYFPFSSTSNPKNRIGTFQSLVSSILLFLSFFLPPAFFPLLLLTLCNFQIHRDKTDEPVPASLDCDFKREESIQYLGVTNSFSPLSFSPLSFSPLSFSTATGTARITSTFYSTSFFHLSFLQFPNSRRRIVLALNSGRANHPSFLPSSRFPSFFSNFRDSETKADEQDWLQAFPELRDPKCNHSILGHRYRFLASLSPSLSVSLLRGNTHGITSFPTRALFPLSNF